MLPGGFRDLLKSGNVTPCLIKEQSHGRGYKVPLEAAPVPDLENIYDTDYLIRLMRDKTETKKRS